MSRKPKIDFDRPAPEGCVFVDICEGVEGPSVYIHDYRVAGPKPWGGGQISRRFTARVENLQTAVERLGTTAKENK